MWFAPGQASFDWYCCPTHTINFQWKKWVVQKWVVPVRFGSQDCFPPRRFELYDDGLQHSQDRFYPRWFELHDDGLQQRLTQRILKITNHTSSSRGFGHRIQLFTWCWLGGNRDWDWFGASCESFSWCRFMLVNLIQFQLYSEFDNHEGVWYVWKLLSSLLIIRWSMERIFWEYVTEFEDFGLCSSTTYTHM